MTQTPTSALDILFEDNHLLVVNKPAGLPTMGTPGDRATLLTVAKNYIREKYAKPGNVYLGIVSRLDAPTTGVVVLARTSKAARRLTEQFRSGTPRKIYWAIVEGVMEPAEDECEDYLADDERHRKMHIVGPGMPGAKAARLRYRRLALLEADNSPRKGDWSGQRNSFGRTKTPAGRVGVSTHAPPGHDSWLEVELLTGRKHQIRLQMSERGHPLLGDRKYGATSRFERGIALHARSLTIRHPVGGTELRLIAPVPACWPRAVTQRNTEPPCNTDSAKEGRS